MDTQPSESADIDLSSRELQLLLLIARSATPVGARELGRRLRDLGPVSESTLNRLMRRLDESGLTISLDGRGRIASEQGKEYAQRVARERMWRSQLSALDIRTLGDVRDLLEARRGLEREVARSVARDVDQAGLERLRRSIDQYGRSMNTERRRFITVDFHKELSALTTNRMLRAAAMVLFDSRFDILEQILDVVTAGHGRIKEGVHEHTAIVDALARGDADAAEAAMTHHLDRLLTEISGDMPSATENAVELLLQTQDFQDPHEDFRKDPS
ncbi:FadR/GntR family transcriptional regulator [Microbacterium sp. NPDC003461]